jgi:hypothetical protein
MRTKAYSSPDHYVQKVLPKLLEFGYGTRSPLQRKKRGLDLIWFHYISIPCRVVRIAPFSNRLAQSVPSNIQALRCLVNYQALRFAEPIRVLAEDMVVRMMKKSTSTGGKYVSVHLRFEEVLIHSLLGLKYYIFLPLY